MEGFLDLLLCRCGTFFLAWSFVELALMDVDSAREGEKVDLIMQEKHNIRPQIGIEELDPWTAWAYKPRTITLLFIGACLLVWVSGALSPESNASTDSVTSVKRGVWAMILVFLAYCLLQAPSTILIRPHPSVWRLVHGLAVVYLVALTFLLFQNRDDARKFMRFLHPDLGVELPERSYGTDCRIYTPENPKSRFNSVYETLFDEFVLAHIFGWWGKAIMIRNQPLLWLLSIGFEVMELTFRHMLPNFNECWWDSIILDILICNWFGIWAGMRTVRYFDAKTYEWVGLSRQPNIIGKEANEEDRSILLAFISNLYSGTPYMHQILPWSISQPYASNMADNLLGIHGDNAGGLLAVLDMAKSSRSAQKEAMIPYLNSHLSIVSSKL
ncbi:CDP-diacylglycerol--serine O-phosphatidyltransferase 1 isoform X2 [Dendrobium catenatum]|uniref:CDP-diacylglycerol--serine O-phosphatidyltransferase 1 isoform X2 n=1 Tax=Dendrobium catenatum TaxID=906689 RepID=UPI00109F3BDA|nr:CDP-diacylglycerol--serine O-phosphatidyltransferase 1 isoform X2 [Dendrobium catenatum]